MPAELIESRAVRPREGQSFTGAATRHIGKFEQANHGTLFLDEIGDMPMLMQAKLLRVLEERQVERVGGDRTIPVDVRVIVATHRNLDELVKKGVFRAGSLPSHLRLPAAAAAAARARATSRRWWRTSRRQVSEQNGWKPKPFLPEAIQELQRYSWPGNVRELRNVVERLLLLGGWRGGRGAVQLALPARRSEAPAAAAVPQFRERSRSARTPSSGNRFWRS